MRIFPLLIVVLTLQFLACAPSQHQDHTGDQSASETLAVWRWQDADYSGLVARTGAVDTDLVARLIQLHNDQPFEPKYRVISFRSELTNDVSSRRVIQFNTLGYLDTLIVFEVDANGSITKNYLLSTWR